MPTSQKFMGRRTALFLAYWIFFTLGVAESSLPPAFPTLADRMNVPLSDMGILFSARAAGFLGMFIFANWLTRRLGRTRFILISLGIIALALPFQPLMPDLPVGILLVALYGIGGGAINVSASVLVGVLNPTERSMALNRLFAYLSVGVIVGPVAIGLTLTQWGTVAPPFWVTAAMLLAALLVLARAPLPPEDSPPSLHFGSGSLFRDARFWVLAVFMLLLMGTYFGFMGWIFSYVRTGLGGEIALASAAASSFGLAELAGRLIRLGPLRRLSDGTVVIGSCASGLAAVLLLLLVRVPLVAVAASIWLGFSFSTLYPTTVGLGQQLRPEESVAVVSVLGMVSALGAITLPWLHGQFMVGDARMWPVMLLGSIAVLVGLAFAVRRGIPSATGADAS